MDADPAEGAAVSAFLAYVRRRSLWMLTTGVAAVAAGISLAITLAGSATAATLILFVVGVATTVQSASGVRCLRTARRLVTGSAQLMELRSWPYRSVRAPVNNRVLVTLDHPGSIDRTPLAELKATWFTPGAAESGERAARVYGSLDTDQMVLAVADDGSCFTGRVTRTRALPR